MPLANLDIDASVIFKYLAMSTCFNLFLYKNSLKFIMKKNLIKYLHIQVSFLPLHIE